MRIIILLLAFMQPLVRLNNANDISHQIRALFDRALVLNTRVRDLLFTFVNTPTI